MVKKLYSDSYARFYNLSFTGEGCGMEKKRITIIVGHYGTGKSEFSVNYAIKESKEHNRVALIDLDNLNMYFRSREVRELLEKHGIRVIGSQIETPAVDVPTVSAEAYAPLQDESYRLLIDVGGNMQGARPLRLYTEYLTDNYDMYYVLNANRPETQNLEQNLQFINEIEGMSGLKLSGIVNNTHLLKSTSPEDVIRGNKLALEVAEKKGVPIIYNTAISSVVDGLPKDIKGEIFPMELFLRKDWMS